MKIAVCSNGAGDSARLFTRAQAPQAPFQRRFGHPSIAHGALRPQFGVSRRGSPGASVSRLRRADRNVQNPVLLLPCRDAGPGRVPPAPEPLTPLRCVRRSNEVPCFGTGTRSKFPASSMAAISTVPASDDRLMTGTKPSRRGSETAGIKGTREIRADSRFANVSADRAGATERATSKRPYGFTTARGNRLMFKLSIVRACTGLMFRALRGNAWPFILRTSKSKNPWTIASLRLTATVGPRIGNAATLPRADYKESSRKSSCRVRHSANVADNRSSYTRPRNERDGKLHTRCWTC